MGLLGRSMGNFPQRRGCSADEWAWSGMPPRSRTAPGAMAGDTVLHASLAAGTVRPAIRPAGHPGLRILLLVHCVCSFPHVRAGPPCVSASGAPVPTRGSAFRRACSRRTGSILSGRQESVKESSTIRRGARWDLDRLRSLHPHRHQRLISHWAVPEGGAAGPHRQGLSILRSTAIFGRGGPTCPPLPRRMHKPWGGGRLPYKCSL